MPEQRPLLLGQAAPAIPQRPAPPAVRAWLAPLGPPVASADWQLVSDVFQPAHPRDTGGAHAVWRSFQEFAKTAGYDDRPAADRDFASFVRSVGGSAGWLRCMFMCNLGRGLLVPHPVADQRFVAGDEEDAYLDDWHTRLRHCPAVPVGNSLAPVNFWGVGPLLSLAPVGAATALADLALEAARRSRSELVTARRAEHGAIFLPMRSGICLAPARAPLSPAMAGRYATPRLLTHEYPPVLHQQQSLLQASPCHPTQGYAYVMMTAAIVSGLLWAYRETHRVFQSSPCYYALTEKFSVGDLAPGDGSVTDALAEYDAIMRAVPWQAVHDRLPYHQDQSRHAASTLLPHQVENVAVRRCKYVRVVSVPRSPQAPLGVMLVEPRLADVTPPALPVTVGSWTVPAGFPSTDLDTVPPSAGEAAASAAYRERKRRHADMARGGPAQSGFLASGSQAVASSGAAAGPAAFPAWGPPGGEHGPRDHEEDEWEANARGLDGSAAGPRGLAALTLAGGTDWGSRAEAREVAPARRVTVAGTLRGVTTTPAQPTTALSAGGRSSRAAVPLPPVATARIAGRAGMAATPM